LEDLIEEFTAGGRSWEDTSWRQGADEDR